MLRCLVTIGIAFLALPAWAQSAAVPERVTAGKIELVDGDVRILDGKGSERRPHTGEVVYSGDTIVTGADGELQATMEDGGYIGVRPDTRMQIVDYRAQGDDEDHSIFSLIQGSFRSVTGWIGKYANRNYQVRTPTVTIGVRGTDHEPKVVPEGSTDGEPGTYDKVNIGATFMDSPQGRVEIGANEAGFAPRGHGVRPRILAHIPAFFRATRNEGRFVGRNEAVRRRIDQLREQRRKVIQERRQGFGKGAMQRSTEGRAGLGNAHAGDAGPVGAERQRLIEQRRQAFEERRAAVRSGQINAPAADRKAAFEARRAAEKSAHEGREEPSGESVEGREPRRHRFRRE